MATISREALRMRNLFNRIFRKLGDGYLAASKPQSGLALCIAERAPRGKQFEGGRNLRFLGGMTPAQVRIVQDTSETVDEAANRCIDFIVHGKDSVTPQSKPAVDPKAIADQVLEQVLAALKQAGAGVPAPAPEPEAPAPEPPAGIQAKPGKSAAEKAAAVQDQEDEVALWTKRAALAGLPKPKLTRLGKVDGRWIRKNGPAWEAYAAGNDA